MPTIKLSIVLPVRDQESEIVGRVEKLLDALIDLTREPSEIILVDDGSRDGTAEVIADLKLRFPQIRIARHERPRGIEAAGQTGLERAAGELVFIQESQSSIRIDDLRRLLHLAEDESVVAARAESREESIAPELLRRLRAWGTDADLRLQVNVGSTSRQALQMLRRSHLQQLTARRGQQIELQGCTEHVATIQRSEQVHQHT